MRLRAPPGNDGEALEVEGRQAGSSALRTKSVLFKGCVLLLLLAPFVACFYFSHQPHASDDLGGRQLLKIRLFWVRHGLSCANVMDKCALQPPASDELIPEAEAALRLIPGYGAAALDRTFGMKPATNEGWLTTGCTIKVAADKKGPAQDGAVVRVHDLYTDPALTSCAREQSVQAGSSFISWLRRKDIKVSFVGSSFLMRAVETAHHMFRVPCKGSGMSNCSQVFDGVDGKLPPITPVPYMTERSPPGLTSIQRDNTPRGIHEQEDMLKKNAKGALHMNTSYAETWPRLAQQYEKFKAFLAMVLVPSLDDNFGFTFPQSFRSQDFQQVLEAQLPQEMHPADHGKPVSLSWEGGGYKTGDAFSKSEYASLRAPEVNVVIVGHNQMMSEYCLAPEFQPKPNNNAVLEKLFILELPKQHDASQVAIMRELRGKCHKVMDAPSMESSRRELAVQDVASCTTPFPVAHYLHLVDKPSLQETNCVNNGRASAFPIMPEFESEFQ